MGGEDAQGNGFPCWLIYLEFFGPRDGDALKDFQKKLEGMFGEKTEARVPARMYLRFKSDGGTEMQDRKLASRFASRQAAEGRVVYLCGQQPDMIGRVGVEKWDGK